jgi:Fe-S-cluster-containing hydrogenase component 2
MLEKDGFLSKEELEKLPGVPSKERLEKGPVVVMECAQKIPCNPCTYACPQKAITIKGDISEIPQVDFKKCVGCKQCISKCPGQAIFVVDKTYSKDKATVALPYEFLPVPKKGREVDLLDRKGEKRGKGKVVEVRDFPNQDCTRVVTVEVPQELAMEVRAIKVSE